MKKSVIFFMTMSLYFSCHAAASSEKFLSPSEQFESFYVLTQSRPTDGHFPELLQQYETNSLAIREFLKEEYLESFDVAHQFAHKILHQENGATLCHFNMTYHLYAYFLEASQKKEKLDFLEIEKRQFCLQSPEKVIQNATSFETQESTPAKITFSSQRGLYPYTVINKKGLFSLELLNKSFAKRRPLCGLPLQRSSYDGGVNETSDRFLTHDWRHIYLATTHWIGLDVFFDVYEKLYNLIEKNEQHAVRSQDHLVLFYMMHEGFNTLTDSAAISCIPSLNSSPKPCMLPCFDFIASCKKTQRSLSKRIQKCTLSFKEQFDPSFKITFTPEQEKTSITDIIESYNFSKNCALDWGEPQDWQEKPKLGWLTNKNKNATGVYMGQYGFDDYNQLFDVHFMLKEAGIEFNVWKDEEFNTLEMNNIFIKIISDFEERYKNQFSDIS